MSARRGDPEGRRAAVIDAAERLFTTRGVAATTVSDIVREAGVAQGTFYLYFDSKEDAANAVVVRMALAVVEAVEAAVDLPGASALDKLFAMRDALIEMGDEPHEQELVALFHRSANMPFHDQMNREISPRLAPVLAKVIEQGIAEDVFEVAHPLMAAHFILGGLQGLDARLKAPEDYAEAVETLAEMALRALGYREQ